MVNGYVPYEAPRRPKRGFAKFMGDQWGSIKSEFDDTYRLLMPGYYNRKEARKYHKGYPGDGTHMHRHHSQKESGSTGSAPVKALKDFQIRHGILPFSELERIAWVNKAIIKSPEIVRQYRSLLTDAGCRYSWLDGILDLDGRMSKQAQSVQSATFEIPAVESQYGPADLAEAICGEAIAKEESKPRKRYANRYSLTEGMKDSLREEETKALAEYFMSIKGIGYKTAAKLLRDMGKEPDEKELRRWYSRAGRRKEYGSLDEMCSKYSIMLESAGERLAQPEAGLEGDLFEPDTYPFHFAAMSENELQEESIMSENGARDELPRNILPFRQKEPEKRTIPGGSQEPQKRKRTPLYAALGIAAGLFFSGVGGDSKLAADHKPVRESYMPSSVAFAMPAPEAPSPPLAGDRQAEKYSVKERDYLWKIARQECGLKYNRDIAGKVADISAKNRLANPDHLEPGWELEL